MKLKSLSIFILLFVTTFSLYSAPKLTVIGGDTYDWGEVSPDQSPLKGKIQLINSGTDTLKISKVKASCGCTTAPIDKKILLKGDTATINVELRVGTYAGRLTKLIKIISNDENKQEMRYYLKCFVVTPLQLSSRSFHFGSANQGQPVKAVVKIKNNTKETIKINDIELKPENIVLSLKKNDSIKPGQEIAVTATAVPEKTGTFRCNVILKTDCKKMKSLRISGWGRVNAPPIFNDKQ